MARRRFRHRHQHRHRLGPARALAVLSAVAFAGCGDAAVPGPTSDPAGFALEGRTFVSTAIEGHTLVGDSQIVLTFDVENVRASAGCNSLVGPFRRLDDILVVDDLVTTEMACEPALTDQDEWLSSLLTERPAVTQAGSTLTLRAGDVTITLVDQEVISPDRPLEETVWSVTTVISGNSAAQAATGASLVLRGGRVEVEFGCNTGAGEYTVEGSTIAFGPITATARVCEDPAVMTLERTIRDVLDGTVAFHIDGDALDLTSLAGGLTLRAA